MRDIEFRVWAENDVNSNGKMYYPGDSLEAGVGGRKNESVFCLSQNGNLFVLNNEMFEKDNISRARWSNSNIVIMQYTGLKDKNGKKIFGGDICNYENIEYKEEMFPIKTFTDWGVIEFERGCFMLNNDGEGCIHNQPVGDIIDMERLGGGHYSVEVIGNIYENPELLEGE